MKQIKMIVFVVIVLLVLSALQYIPTVKGQGSTNSLAFRVAELEALVKNLNNRVAALENGQVPPGTSFEVLNLTPLNEFPGNPSNGDLCVVLTEWVWAPGTYAYQLYCYLSSSWHPAGFWIGAAGEMPGDPGP